MYAVIQTGGKQYRVSEGSTLRVEKIDAAEGVGPSGEVGLFASSPGIVFTLSSFSSLAEIILRPAGRARACYELSAHLMRFVA